MSLWTSLFGGITATGVQKVVDSGTNAAKAVFGDRAARDEFAAQSDMASIAANHDFYMPGPYIPPHSGIIYLVFMWFLWMVHAAVTLIVRGGRPLIVFGAFYIAFVWPYTDPEGFVIYMNALSLTPEYLRELIAAILLGFLGLRTFGKDILGFASKKWKGPSVQDARDIMQLKEELAESRKRQERLEGVLFDTEPNQTIQSSKKSD